MGHIGQLGRSKGRDRSSGCSLSVSKLKLHEGKTKAPEGGRQDYLWKWASLSALERMLKTGKKQKKKITNLG